MGERHANRIAYTTLVDIAFNVCDPDVYLEIGMEKPVDWGAVDADGSVICRRLGFRLIVEGAGGIGILCGYDRTVRDFGLHHGRYVYIIRLVPLPDEDGKDDALQALDIIAREARLKGKPLCGEVRGIGIYWRHAPEDVAATDNGSYVPDPDPSAAPRASDDDVLRMCSALDDFFAEEPDPEEPVIPLDESDIEFEIDIGPTDAFRDYSLFA